MRPVWKVCNPYPEVIQGRVTEDSFVVTVGGIWEKIELGKAVEVDERYLNPEGFVKRTHFTDAMTNLIENVTKRLNGESVQSVYHLRVGMGGGKSHTLLLLYYLARYTNKVAPIIRARAGINSTVLQNVNLAIIDGSRISPLFGFSFPDGIRVNTPWGLMFKQFGIYDDYKDIDHWRIAPSVDILKDILSKGPTLILIDELTYYVENVRSETMKANKVQLFIQALTTAVKEVKGCVLIVTTPVGVYEEAYSLVSKLLDRYSKPLIVASGKEYKSIRKRALFKDDFDEIKDEIRGISDEYCSNYKKHLPSYTSMCEELVFENYPFHPFVDRTLLKLKSNKAFQEVRDELRFLGGLVYSVYKTKHQDAYLITTGHADLEDQYVRAGTIAKLQDPTLVARLDDELTRTKHIEGDDEFRLLIRKTLATIVLNSLAAETPLQRGVSEEEAVYALLTPYTSPELIKKSLRECGKRLWFVNITDGRWVFGSPNLNKLVDDYLKKVERDRSLRGLWWDNITRELKNWKSSAYRAYIKKSRVEKRKPLFQENNTFIWPTKSEEIPDDREIKLIFLDYYLPLKSIIPLEFLNEDESVQGFEIRVATNVTEAKGAAKELYENYGTRVRDYKNTVLFLVADRNLIEKDGPIRCAKELLALEQMVRDREQLLPLIGEKGIRDVEQLRANTVRDLLPACVMGYRYLIYPSKDGLAYLELGEERRDLSGFLTILERKLKDEVRKVVDDITVGSLVTRYWPQGRDRVEVKELMDGFYKRPELELISERGVAENAVRSALRDKKLAYMFDHETFYGKEPSRLEDTGILIKNPELVTLKLGAVNYETNETLNIDVRLDRKETKRTPFKYEDLKGSTHMLNLEIPEELELVNWSDGLTEESRTLVWDRNRTLNVLIKPKEEVPPPKEVAVTITAMDVLHNAPLDVIIEIDDEIYSTPFTQSFEKDSIHKIKIQAPKGMSFVGWNDRVIDMGRELMCDVDTTLVAKFRPLSTGVEIEQGTVSFELAHRKLKDFLQREVNAVKFEMNLNYKNFMKSAGTLGNLLKVEHEATLTASGGSKLGLEQFNVKIKGGSEKFGVIKGCIAQLRDYLENVALKLDAELEEYEQTDNVISAEALEALKKTGGSLSYRLQLRRINKEGAPKRAIEELIEKFVEES